jgi:hypothetical protein
MLVLFADQRLQKVSFDQFWSDLDAHLKLALWNKLHYEVNKGKKSEQLKPMYGDITSDTQKRLFLMCAVRDHFEFTNFFFHTYDSLTYEDSHAT